MRKLLVLIVAFISVWSCEWRPDEVAINHRSVLEALNITPGDTVKIELQSNGINFSPIDNPDTSVVEIINHLSPNLGSQLLLIGKSEGQVSFSFSYEIHSESDPTYMVIYQVHLQVSESIPLRIFIGEEYELDLSTHVTAQELASIDSVSYHTDQSSTQGQFDFLTLSDVNTILVLNGTIPGNVPMIVDCFDMHGSLVKVLYYDVDVSIRKVVLGELYTNTGCVNCPQANHYVDNLLLDFEDEFTVVRYHVNWTDPSDPMNEYNPFEVEARRAYYNIIAAPSLVLDGTLVTSLDEDDWSGRIFNASQMRAPIYISPITVLESTDSLHLDYDLDSFGEVLTDITAWSLVLEDSIEYTGSNGEDLHMQVMRDMTSSSINSLTTLTTIHHSLKKPLDYGVAGHMNILVFVQSDSDKAVLQSRQQDLD